MEVFVKTFMVSELHFRDQRMEFTLLAPGAENFPHPHPFRLSPSLSPSVPALQQQEQQKPMPVHCPSLSMHGSKFDN